MWENQSFNLEIKKRERGDIPHQIIQVPLSHPYVFSSPIIPIPNHVIPFIIVVVVGGGGGGGSGCDGVDVVTVSVVVVVISVISTIVVSNGIIFRAYTHQWRNKQLPSCPHQATLMDPMITIKPTLNTNLC